MFAVPVIREGLVGLWRGGDNRKRGGGVSVISMIGPIGLPSLEAHAPSRQPSPVLIHPPPHSSEAFATPLACTHRSPNHALVASERADTLLPCFTQLRLAAPLAARCLLLSSCLRLCLGVAADHGDRFVCVVLGREAVGDVVAK